MAYGSYAPFSKEGAKLNLFLKGWAFFMVLVDLNLI